MFSPGDRSRLYNRRPGVPFNTGINPSPLRPPAVKPPMYGGEKPYPMPIVRPDPKPPVSGPDIPYPMPIVRPDPKSSPVTKLPIGTPTPPSSVGSNKSYGY